MPEYNDPVARDAIRELRNRVNRQDQLIRKLQANRGVVMSRGPHTDVPNPYEGQVMIGMDGKPYYYGEQAWHPFGGGDPTLIVKAVPDQKRLLVESAAFTFAIPRTLDGAVLSEAQGFVWVVSTSGKPEIKLWKNSSAMLATNITVDVSEQTSYTASVPPVVHGTIANRTVATGDIIRIEIIAAGTATKGAGVHFYFGA